MTAVFYHHLFAMHAETAGHKPALEFGNALLSYRELNGHANMLARY